MSAWLRDSSPTVAPSLLCWAGRGITGAPQLGLPATVECLLKLGRLERLRGERSGRSSWMGLAPTTVRARAEASAPRLLCSEPDTKPKTQHPCGARGPWRRPWDVYAHTASWWQLMKRLALPVSRGSNSCAVTTSTPPPRHQPKCRRSATSSSRRMPRHPPHRCPGGRTRPSPRKRGASRSPRPCSATAFAQHPEWAGTISHSRSRAHTPTVPRTEKPTQARRCSSGRCAPHVTEKALTSTADRNYANTLRSHGRAPSIYNLPVEPARRA